MRTFHMIVLLLSGLGALGMGMSALGAVQQSNSAIHEIEMLICGLTIAVVSAAGYIAAAIDQNAKRQQPTQMPQPQSQPWQGQR